MTLSDEQLAILLSQGFTVYANINRNYLLDCHNVIVCSGCVFWPVSPDNMCTKHNYALSEAQVAQYPEALI